MTSDLVDPNANLPKTRWIRELRQEGLSPIMQILETIEAGNNALYLACQREMDWINDMQRREYSLLKVMGVTRNYSAAYFPNPGSYRQRSEKRTGGQPGHIGYTLMPVSNPDEVMRHPTISAETASSGWWVWLGS